MIHARRIGQALAAGGVAVVLALGGSVAATADDYPSDTGSFGSSKTSAWTVSASGVATVAGDPDRGSVLRIAAKEGALSRVLHYMSSGTFPTVDAAYQARTTWARFLDGTRDPGSTLPYADGAAAAVRVSAGATLYLDMAIEYVTADGEPAETTWTCELPASESWQTLDIYLCNYYQHDVFAWPNSNWRTTEDWTYRTSSTGTDTGSYAAGAYIPMASTITFPVPVGIGFRVEGPAGAMAWVDDVVIRDSALSFTAAPTTIALTVKTSGAAVPGVNASLSAAVSPKSAEGTVRFLDGSTLIAEGAVADGVFSATATNLGLGAHSLSATFVPSDEGAYAASSADPVVVTVNEKRSTPVPAPASNTDALLALPDTQKISPDEFVPSSGSGANADGTFSPSKPLSGELPWSDESDSYVDVYGYSSPVYLGTFPVVNGVVQLSGVNLAALNGNQLQHHLVFVGQTSGSVAVFALTLADELSKTGAGSHAPLFAGGALLLGGLVLLTVRRSRLTARRA